MKRKPMILRICAGILAIMILCLLGTTLLDIYGNPIKKWQLKDDFQSYFDAHFSHIEDAYTCGNVSYNGKLNDYFVSCENKTQPLLSFSIERTSEGEFFDSYTFNIVEGSNFLATISNQIYNDLMERYGDEIPELNKYLIYVDTPLHQLDKDIQDALYNNVNIYEQPIYSLYYFGGEASESYEQGEYVQSRFKQMKTLIQQTDFVPISYRAAFFDKEGNTGYELIKVSEEIMERADFAAMVEEVKKAPQKYKEQYGFERIDFEEK